MPPNRPHSRDPSVLKQLALEYAKENETYANEIFNSWLEEVNLQGSLENFPQFDKRLGKEGQIDTELFEELREPQDPFRLKNNPVFSSFYKGLPYSKDELLSQLSLIENHDTTDQYKKLLDEYSKEKTASKPQYLKGLKGFKNFQDYHGLSGLDLEEYSKEKIASKPQYLKGLKGFKNENNPLVSIDSIYSYVKDDPKKLELLKNFQDYHGLSGLHREEFFTPNSLKKIQKEVEEFPHTFKKNELNTASEIWDRSSSSKREKLQPYFSKFKEIINSKPWVSRNPDDAKSPKEKIKPKSFLNDFMDNKIGACDIEDENCEENAFLNLIANNARTNTPRKRNPLNVAQDYLGKEDQLPLSLVLGFGDEKGLKYGSSVSNFWETDPIKKNTVFSTSPYLKPVFPAYHTFLAEEDGTHSDYKNSIFRSLDYPQEESKLSSLKGASSNYGNPGYAVSHRFVEGYKSPERPEPGKIAQPPIIKNTLSAHDLRLKNKFKKYAQ